MEFKCKACGAFDTRACNGDNEICTECGTIDDFIELEEIWHNIADLYDYICGLGKGDPTSIVMSPEGFAEWYYFCEHNGLDWKEWEGVPVILHKEGIFPVAVSYAEPNENFVNDNEQTSE